MHNADRNEKKALIVGDANVDIIVPFPKFLNEQRTKVEFETPCMQGGGTAANTAVALSKLGVSTGFLGTIGKDQYGQYIVKDFQKNGIDTSQMIIDENLNTVGVFAFIDEFGERYLWGWPRTEQAFKEIDPDKVDFEKIKNASWVHSSGMAIVHDSSARSTITKILKTAFEAGVPTSFDLNLRVDDGNLDPAYRDAVMEVIQYCSYVLGSGEDEFYYLNPKEDWTQSAKSFVTPNRTVVARMGKKGCMGMTSEKVIEKPIFPFEVVDTVGAGDVYNAGFIAARLEGKSFEESLEWGNAVSGFAVHHKGARNTPNRKQLLDILKMPH